MSRYREPRLTRRHVVQTTGAAMLAGGGVATLLVRPAAATPASMQAAVRKVVGEAKVSVGRVRLEIPPLSENGNAVTCSVTVDSPMTPSNYVKAIHLFNEKNPQPNVISAHLGPRAGRARVQTRIRLSDTQTVMAIAELSDGSFWSHSANVIVTLGACLEDPQ
jgi:sulfur-oxidizing protein SoxY